MIYYKIENGKYNGDIEQDDFYGSVTDVKPPEFDENTHVALFVGCNDGYWQIITREEYESMFNPPQPIQVPQSITPLQAKLQLLEMELLDEVEAMVATDRKISLYWNEALEIRRDHATLLAMVGALGLTDAQVDEMFIEASKLS